MNLPINPNPPHIMHIDLNSCFATIEQQAHRTLRGKPLVIAAYDSPKGCILAPSIEAKTYGIKTGMRIQEARLLCPHIIVRTADTTLIRDVHMKFKKIAKDYSSNVRPKSIDEVVIDFSQAPPGWNKNDKNNPLVKIGREIKYRLCHEVGDWLRCNVGIATNRFQAKLAAGLHKPDGLDVLTEHNLLAVYKLLSLTDLPGTNVRYQKRLIEHNITTPYELYTASALFLKKQVFSSIVGYYWYVRLRGWEIDEADVKQKSFGQEYSLTQKTDNPFLLSRLLLKLCEKMGRRLRMANYTAQGIHIGCLYDDYTYFHKGEKTLSFLYTTRELFHQAKNILQKQPQGKKVIRLSVRCFNLQPTTISQLDLFDQKEKYYDISKALDRINDTYGEFSVVPALMMNMKDTILDRIAFGRVEK